jgi:hypothetical protein
MAKINEAIQTQNFELIRDRIAQILTVELANQATLTGNALFNAKVWLERFIAFDKTELPAINVYLNNTSYDNQTAITSKGSNTYYIDVHVSAKHSTTNDGDKTASINLQKLLGVVRYILEHSVYLTLDFSRGFIYHTAVSEIKVGQPNDKDGYNTVTGRITFDVNCEEKTKPSDPIEAFGYYTDVRIGETDKGFFYETLNI